MKAPDLPPRIGLALSGGGIRSAAFALGVLHGLVRGDKLHFVDYLSSVSGGGYTGTALTWMLSTYRLVDVRGRSASKVDQFPLGSWRQGVYGTDGNRRPEPTGSPERKLDWIRQRAGYLTPGQVKLTRTQPGTGAADGDATASGQWLHAPSPLGIISVIGVALRSMTIGIAVYIPLIFAILITAAWITLAVVPDSLVDAMRPLVGSTEPACVPTHETTHPCVRTPGTPPPLPGLSERWTTAFVLVALGAAALFAVSALSMALLTRTEKAETALRRALAFMLFVLAPVTWILTWTGTASLTWAMRLCLVAAWVLAAGVAFGARFVAHLGSYGMRTWVQWSGGWLVGIASGAAVLATLPHVMTAVGGVWSASGLTLFGIASAVAKWLLGRSESKGGSALSLGTIGLAGGLAMTYGVLFLGYDLAQTLHGQVPSAGWLLAIAGVMAFWSIALGRSIDLNYVTPHRMYRDRLMEAFMRPADRPRPEWQDAENGDRAMLADMCGCHPQWSGDYAGPYHIINTNLVLTRSRHNSRRGRGGDNFILSPLYCGSTATGWHATRTYVDRADQGLPPRSITLATAMAISGAAASPHAGASGRGVTRSWPVSFLMNLLNLRLGYADLNPHECLRKSRQIRPDALRPGLAHLLGRRLDEESHFIELTDGGHFENLGLYELLRRRATLIVCADAACDPRFRFADLATSIERARVDFGVNIVFMESHGLGDCVIPTDAAETPFAAKTAKRGFALAHIVYPPRDTATGASNEPKGDPEFGLLIYIKSTMTAEMPADLFAYRADNPTFPHQSTSDQFFDEVQFECYRELGYRLTKAMIDEPLVACFLGRFGKEVPLASRRGAQEALQQLKELWWSPRLAKTEADASR